MRPAAGTFVPAATGPGSFLAGESAAGRRAVWAVGRSAAPATDWRALSTAERACCCPAKPVVVVVVPPADLLLCGHHYRAARTALAAVGASAFDRSGWLR